ncbi:MAG TPA: sulfotransferase [Woeseiaceae bacterium]|nr:sulfotransferase [Woeseiaceae bacterium]
MTAQAAASSPADDVVLQAKAFLQQGEFAKAAGIAKQGIADDRPERANLFYVLAVAQRYQEQLTEALDTLATLIAIDPRHARAWQERGHTLLTQNRLDEAREAYEKAVGLNPALVASWKALANLYELAGRKGDVRRPLEQAQYLTALPEELLGVAGMIHDNKLAKAERLCRHFLRKNPHHVEGLRLLAQIADRLDVSADAEFLLESCVELAPEHDAARQDYANHLLKMQNFGKAFEQCRTLIERQPENPVFRSLLASATAGIGKHEEAVAIFDDLLAKSPNQNTLYVMRGHAQKTIGDIDGAIASYRKAYEVRPDYGDAFWSLANTKTYRFAEEEIAHMKRFEAAPDTGQDDRIHLCFALGKALEDRREFEVSFEYYVRGNALKQETVQHQATHLAIRTQAQIEVCTREFFEERNGVGSAAPDPIFIVGLPRAGSTLLEQILASHAQVDGTMELPNIIALAQRLRNSRFLVDEDGTPRYPTVLKTIDPDYFRRFGEQFINDTRVYRGDAPYFIDKNPNNFFHIGLIRLILPNAKVIDARRHPMACCFSGFKQLFGQGQEFSYGLEALGNYYRQYVELIDHWDAVLPGFVLRVQHEDVVDDLETQVRRILDFCKLPFEQACLEFHRTDRSVRTPSSEQVRQPIYRSGLEQWRNYEPWLTPLKSALKNQGQLPESR